MIEFKKLSSEICFYCKIKDCVLKNDNDFTENIRFFINSVEDFEEIPCADAIAYIFYDDGHLDAVEGIYDGE